MPSSAFRRKLFVQPHESAPSITGKKALETTRWSTSRRKPPPSSAGRIPKLQGEESYKTNVTFSALANVGSPLTVRGIRRFDRELAINKGPTKKFYRYGNKKASRLVIVVGLLRYRGDCLAILKSRVTKLNTLICKSGPNRVPPKWAPELGEPQVSVNLS
jgi:hypothetical protein